MSSSPTKKLRGLYVISDEKLIPQNCFAETIEQTLRGGARIIQYRDKSTDKKKRYAQASALKNLCEQYQATLIINDDVELTLQVNADGIHLGKHDATIAATRNKLGSHKIIGVSCYNQFELATTAEKNGANYIAFGSFFPSSTKPDAVRADPQLLFRANQALHIPVCAIGGITLAQAPALLRDGADMVAVITDVFTAGDIENRCKEFSSLFECE